MSLQPTNAGMNFQHRLGAQFLSIMLTESSLADWLKDSRDNLQKIRFESFDEIDDLVLENNQGDVYYIQAKRTISLSENKESIFYKTVHQFIRQYCSDTDKNKVKYYLAVSSECSANIASRLRRILNNIRSSRSITDLTLNKSDKNIFNTFLSVVRLAYKDFTDEEIGERTLLDLCEHVYIDVFDLEEGQSGEIACKMLLASYYPKIFAVLWERLIKEALELATNRSMVTYEYIKEKYINEEALKAPDRFFKYETTGETQIGYDVILARSPELLEIVDEEGKYARDSLIVLQLYRFDESGKKEVSHFILMTA